MPEIAGAKALYSAQVRFRRTAIGLYGDAAREIGAVLARASGFDGLIPPGREADVVSAAGEVAQRLFVARDGRSVYGRDGVTALAPFPQALNVAVVNVTAAVVRAHHDWLKRNVPPDVFAWLGSARPRPVSEQIEAGDVFRPNPLAQYDPLHLWVDPNGYRLSDRIWHAGTRTRMRLDALVAEGIRNGTSAIEISRQVERFLLPNRAPLRAKKPYGRDASFDGMRLARTEITAAHGRATMAAARANPYVERMAWRLSASHPKTDHCDDNAANGPYALDSIPPYPDHPHCLCCLVPQVSAAPAQVTARLRELMAAGEPPPYVTPANQQGFLLELLGTVLMLLVERVV